MTSKRSFLLGLAAASVGAAAGPLRGEAAVATPTRPTPPPTNIDEAKVGAYTLTDPLKLADGRPVRDARAWTEHRRLEILSLFEQNQFGVTPGPGPTPHYEIVERDGAGLGGLAHRTQVRIRFSKSADAPFIRALIFTPVAAKGPVPTLLHIGFSPAILLADEPGIDTGMAWSGKTKSRVPDKEALRLADIDMAYFVKRGYGVAFVYYGDIEPDFEGGAPLGVRSLFGPQTEPRKPDEWGSIGAWSWGLSRVLDYLQTDPRVDGRKRARIRAVAADFLQFFAPDAKARFDVLTIERGALVLHRGAFG